MDLESAVQAVLNGELGIVMETTEEAQAIVDCCCEFGVDTMFLPAHEVPAKWTVFGVNRKYPQSKYPVFWNSQNNFEHATGIYQSMRFSDLLPAKPDLSDVEILL